MLLPLLMNLGMFSEAQAQPYSPPSNTDWLKKRKGKPKVIRRSEFASRDEYEQALKAALVSIPLSQVEIPDVIEEEDDDALLAVMLRVLH